MLTAVADHWVALHEGRQSEATQLNSYRQCCTVFKHLS